MDTTAHIKHGIVFPSEEITQETANSVVPKLLRLGSDTKIKSFLPDGAKVFDELFGTSVHGMT